MVDLNIADLCKYVPLRRNFDLHVSLWRNIWKRKKSSWKNQVISAASHKTLDVGRNRRSFSCPFVQKSKIDVGTPNVLISYQEMPEEILLRKNAKWRENRLRSEKHSISEHRYTCVTVKRSPAGYIIFSCGE